MTRSTPAQLGIALAWACVLAGALAVACGGCASTIRGGTSSRTDEHTVQAPGESRTEAHTTATSATGTQQHTQQDAVVEVAADGRIVVRVGHAAASTQPVQSSTETVVTATTRPTVATEQTRTTTAATQPSASSPTGLPAFRFNGDGDVTGVWFEADRVAANLKARAPLVTVLALAGVAFLFFRRWLPGAACLACAAAVALVSQWLVDAVTALGFAGVAGYLAYEILVKHRTIRDLTGTPDAKGGG